MKSYHISNHQYQECVKDIIEFSQPGDWFFLSGDLGAGKTTLVRFIAQSLGNKENITSPTFSLFNEINVEKKFEKIVHIDLYRIKKDSELLYLGLESVLNENSIAFFEWPEQISEYGWNEFLSATLCPKPRTIWWIKIEISQDNSRTITIESAL